MITYRRALLAGFASCVCFSAMCEATQVQDEMSNPVPGVLVRRLEPSMLQMPPTDEQWTTVGVTGKDGRFAADQQSSRSFYILTKPGFASLALNARKEPEPAVNLLKGAQLSGVVLDEHGTSVPGALLGPFHPMLQLPDRGAEAPPVSEAGAPLWTTTDASGCFHVEGLSAGLQGFLIRAEGFAPHMAVRPAGLDTSVTLTTEGTTWTGVLLGSRDKQPQPGIYVEAVSGLLRAYAKTNARGEFTFTHLPGQDWQFRTAGAVTAVPKSALLVKKRRSFAGNVLTLLHNQCVTLAGTVVDPSTKSPIAGVGLQLDAFQDEDPVTTTTDELGRFEFNHADAFRSLTLKFSDYVCRTPQNTYWSEVPVDTMRGEDITTLSYSLLRRVTAHGKVQGPGGRLVPGAMIQMILRSTKEPGFRDFLGRVRYQAKSDSNGAFDATLFPPGTYEVTASAASLSSGKLSLEAQTSGSTEWLIALKPNRALRGKTLDAAGLPLPDCRIELAATALDTTSSLPSVLDSIRSDVSGNFSFQGALPDSLRLSATHPSSDDTISTDVILADTTGPLILQFGLGKLFVAHVLDENGNPLANTIVQVYADQKADVDSSAAKLLVRRTTEDGRAAFGLNASRVLKINARHKEYAPFSAGPVALPNENFEIRMRPNPSVVVNVTGTPAANDAVRQVWLLRSPGDASQDPLSAFFQSVRRQESRDGHALFTNITPGWYKVSTSNGTVFGESDAFEVKAESGRMPIDLPLAEGATLRGRVLDEKSGSPVPGAQVKVQLPCCTPQGFESDPVATDTDGKYELAGLPAAAMLVTVKHPDYAESAQHVRVPGSGDKRLDVRLGHETSSLSGRVTLDSKPLPNAAIYIYRASNRSEYAESAVTDTDGKYTIESLPEGDHVLEAQALWGTDQVEMRRTMEIRVHGKTSRQDVSFDSLVHVTGRVRSNPDEEGPNPNRTLWFSLRASPDDLGQTFRSAQLNENGDYEVYLEPGSYVVGLQEGSGIAVDIPLGGTELVANYELRDLAEASGINLVPTGASVVPKEVPDNQGL
jgi:protocatechuate 3,4-dioxygenase beta subunit